MALYQGKINFHRLRVPRNYRFWTDIHGKGHERKERYGNLNARDFAGLYNDGELILAQVFAISDSVDCGHSVYANSNFSPKELEARGIVIKSREPGLAEAIPSVLLGSEPYALRGHNSEEWNPLEEVIRAGLVSLNIDPYGYTLEIDENGIKRNRFISQLRVPTIQERMDTLYEIVQAASSSSD